MPDNSFRGLFVSRPVQALSIRGQWPIVCVHSRPVIISPPRIHSYTEHAAAGSRGTRSPLVPCGVNVLLCLLFSLLSWSESRLNIEVGGKKRNKRKGWVTDTSRGAVQHHVTVDSGVQDSFQHHGAVDSDAFRDTRPGLCTL